MTATLMHQPGGPGALQVVLGGVLGGVLCTLFLLRVNLTRMFLLRHLPRPPGHFILGNMRELGHSSHRTLAAWAETYGGVFYIRVLVWNVVVVTCPDIYSRFLRAGPEALPKQHVAYKAFEQITLPPRPNLLSSPADAYWKVVRKASASAFTMANLKANYSAISGICARVVDHLVQLGPMEAVEMDLMAQRLTMDIIGSFGFAHDFGCTTFGSQEASAAGLRTLGTVQKGMAALQDLMMNPLYNWVPALASWRGIKRAFHEFDGVVGQLLQDLLAERGQQPQHTLAAHLLGCRDPATGEPLTLEQLKAEVALFWVAGFETTAHTIGWACMLLATHPEVEARLAAELQAHGLLATPGNPTPRASAWEDLGKLRYLSAVVNETTRMFPAAGSGTLRMTTSPVEAGGYKLPTGVTVWIPFYAVQRSSRHWPEPHSFKPERWLAEDLDSGSGAAEDVAGAGPAAAEAGEQGAGPAGAARRREGGGEGGSRVRPRPHAPFSEGPRSCVGQSLALLEIKAFLAAAVARLTFRLREDMGGLRERDADGMTLVTLKPAHGHWMYCTPRVPG